MASLQHKLLKLQERQRAGKRAVVKIAGVPYDFVAVYFGGVSPSVVLRGADGNQIAHTAAEWRRLGAEI